MVDPSQLASLKAALLLSRVLIKHLEGEAFSLTDNSVYVDEMHGLVCYEDMAIDISDMIMGALRLLDSLTREFAEVTDYDPINVAHLMELSVSVQDTLTDAIDNLDNSAEPL